MAHLLPGRTRDPATTHATVRAEPQHGEPTVDLMEDVSATRPVSIIAPRRIGESALTVYPIGLGTSLFGWRVDDETATSILDEFAGHGGTLIDTADSYADGGSERIIGRWMLQRGNRDHVVLSTKIGRHRQIPGLGPVNIVRAVEASLERLQTDRIDLLYFDGDDLTVPLEESLATVEWLIGSGKVRYLGASNYSAERLTEARILSSSGLPQFVAMQCHYNLMHRAEFEGDLAMAVAAQNLAVIPNFPLAKGFLTGKHREKNDVARSVRSAHASEYGGRKGNRVRGAMHKIAAVHGVPIATIALAWLVAKRNIAAPIAGASSPAQVEALTDAAGIRLSRSQMLELDRVS